ncbi:MAG: uracil phosphoribosyltransferase, partial [Bacteroidales bacterium]|nr:uracil phosphoribosyltransferase [Bacteroidales bacterium]
MLRVLDHPLITHKLSLLRNKNTCTKDFRENLAEISGLMAYEVSRDLPLREIEVETPISHCRTKELAADIVLIPILRAGLGMVNGITNLIPTAKVGHVGMYRDEKTLEPVSYYAKLPSNLPVSVVLILDPMLATGGSASATITEVKKRGARSIKLVSIVGAPEGVKRIQNDHPDVEIVLAVLDEKLNEYGYI